MQASGDGLWELDRADGSAWFSDWFGTRLPTPAARRPAFHDLRPIMSPETWDTLLRKLRSHLEERSPPDTEFQVQLAQEATPSGGICAAQRNATRSVFPSISPATCAT
jgi:hypothetical protein